MTEEYRELLYRFIDRGSHTGNQPKYLLQCFTFYPKADPSIGRGPYCFRWFDVKAGDRKRAERELAEKGFIPASESDAASALA